MKPVLRPFIFMLGALFFYVASKECITPDFLIPPPEDESMLALYGFGIGIGIVLNVLAGCACLIFALVDENDK